MLTDSFGRKINYLRLSVTDRCNFRCRYCMPAHGVPKLEKKDVLSYEELLLAARVAVDMGIEKIRITGGEPLLRKGLLPFLSRVSAIPGLRKLVLTTNGLLLPEMAGKLRDAGVQHLNISLDSLRPDVFSSITRGGDLRRVQAGVAAAVEAGFLVKLNMVVMRGVNEGELADFAALTLQHPFSVRFIEYMPATCEENWQRLVLTGDEILSRLDGRFSFTPVVRGELAGPAREFRIAGAKGCIGVITPLSGHFCSECNRIRVTAAGIVRNCLFAGAGFDLRPLLATGDAGAVAVALRQVVHGKPEMHSLGMSRAEHAPFTMSGIGG